jgi:hypothetical protein
MEGYMGSLRVNRPPANENFAQLQGKISTLIEKIQEFAISILRQPQV